MHIHFHLRQVDDLYYIDAQEDIIQPRVSMKATLSCLPLTNLSSAKS